MKKLFITIVLFLTAFTIANAQLLRVEELEKYAKQRYGDKWIDAATNLASQLSLDKNNALTYTQIIETPGKTKNQLYVLLNYWFTATFNDANSAITLNDKELGTIIAQGYMSNIAEHAGGSNSYYVSIKPIIKCDIKDEKIRVTYTVPYYDVTCMVGGGWIGIFSDDKPIRSDEKWTFDKCFPFVAKDSHKRTSSKALIMTHAYSNVIIDKIEECVKNGLVGNEDDDW
ncbi:MAG: DUF4468 domain-containing protein [Prevotellaceae bacterium]|nr:DUF4468 domain-containing protein [Prevotellaceae bacterium]